MERNTNNNQSSGNGFLLGVIVGVLLTLLLTTKKGRVILKELMEKGVEKFANLEEIMKDTAEDFDDVEEEDGDDFIVSEPVDVEEKPLVKKETSKEIVDENPPVSLKKEIIHQKPVKEAAEVQKKVDEDNIPDDEPVESETKSKTVRGKRWFRGLRKKG